jgi:hypothetical protein
MKNLVFITAVSFCLAGCLEFDILIKVNPDGSGTVEQTVLMNKAIVSQMEEMAKSFGAKEEKNKKGFSLIDKKKLVEEAKSMGKGVRFISAKPLSTKDQMGYISYYSFKDINTLMVKQDPSGKVPIEQESEQSPPEEPTKFSFKPGTPATLVIHSPGKSFAPDSASDGSKESQPEADDTSGLETMMEMMKGFRMSFVVECNGTITETNATNVNGSKVTLLDINFEQLIRNRDKFKEISMYPPKTPEEMKKSLKDIPGIKMELTQEVTMQFK